MQIRQETNSNKIQSLSDSISLVMEDVKNLSTYIAINQEVNQILSSNQPEQLNQDTGLWKKKDAIQMVEDMIALKGYTKTVAIYPENGVNPYLCCLDYSSYLSDMDLVRDTRSYQDVLEKRKLRNRRMAHFMRWNGPVHIYSKGTLKHMKSHIRLDFMMKNIFRRYLKE